MAFSVLYTPDFEKQYKKLSKKYPSLTGELTELSLSLAENPTQGIPLGNACFKIRLAISSKGKGKSGGARIITCVVVVENEVYLGAIYDKSESVSISDKELKLLVKQILSKK